MVSQVRLEQVEELAERDRRRLHEHKRREHVLFVAE